jgi:hypothetical protein
VIPDAYWSCSDFDEPLKQRNTCLGFELARFWPSP